MCRVLDKYILALDAGTTSGRAILFTPSGRMVASAQRPLALSYPKSGWVEQDPEEIWRGMDESVRETLALADVSARQIAAIGIANQRETTLVWDRKTGRPLYPAIVWQDRRTSENCAKLRHENFESVVQSRTGLVLDPYFSATKICWILDNVQGARLSAEQGDLCFGTPDTWLIWKITQGRHHVTDATNASRTALFNIHKQLWDTDLMQIFQIPESLLPQVIPSVQNTLTTAPDWLGHDIAITGIAGDQQAALVGQGCTVPGMLKATYGTGGFLMLNTGTKPIASQNRLLTTIGYQLGNEPTYALEGAIFNTGTAVQWLSQQLEIFLDSKATAELAAQANPNSAVVLVPAFTGIGAPYWEADARGLIYGLTRDTGKAELTRAALEATMFQTRDLLDAVRQDGETVQSLRIDGGMTKNSWLCQCLADGLQLPVERSTVTESTAMGAALLAMLGAGQLTDIQEASAYWSCEQRFEPLVSQKTADSRYAIWQDALARTLLKT